MTQARWIALAGLLGLLVAVGAMFLMRPQAPPPAGAVGGPFHLTDQNGRAVDEKLLNGKWSVVFFGFTYCPDACPTTLALLGRTLDQLGPNAAKVQVVFVSVDPERDTPAALKAYLSSATFPRGTIGLTGTPAQVAAVAKAYKVYYAKSGSGADYTIDHSTLIYLMDPKGRFSRIIPYGLTPEEVKKQIADAMRGA